MSWQEHRYQVLITRDGSPTLQSLAIETQEIMHHSGGAYAETQLIYGEPLRQRFDQGQTRVLSLGLGLGYNEILVACEAIKRNLPPEQVFLVSYESEDILKEKLMDFLLSFSNQTDEEFQTYKTILNFYLQNESFELAQIKKFLLELKEKNRWLLLGKFAPESLLSEKFNTILYDAFSAKTTPELWSEEFLNLVWRTNAADHCTVSTYACRSLLRKTLKENGFTVVEGPGFEGKRKNTIAMRN